MTVALLDDVALVHAEPTIPGLPAVLNPVDLAHTLGWDVATAEIRYLRYKAGVSLVAGLRLTDSQGTSSFAQAFAYPPEAVDKLDKIILAGRKDTIGRGAAVDVERGVGLADVTADRHLVGVRHVLSRDAAVEQLVYKPGRRWVAALTAHGRRRLVKVHPPEDMAALEMRHRALESLPVQPLLHMDHRRGIVESAWVDGISVDAVDTTTAPALWRASGAALARVHALPPHPGLEIVDVAATTRAAVAALEMLQPDVLDQARRIANRILDGLRGDVWRGVVHGDFSADQVIAGPDSRHPGVAPVTIVDLDRVATGEPMMDLGSWFGALAATTGASVDVEAELADLLEGYRDGGGEVHPGRLRLYAALGVLQRASEPFRRHQDNWPSRVQRLVDLSGELA